MDILKLGLLHGINQDEATEEEESEWLTYPHKIFQDFLVGYYSSKKSTQVNIHGFIDFIILMIVLFHDSVLLLFPIGYKVHVRILDGH